MANSVSSISNEIWLKDKNDKTPQDTATRKRQSLIGSLDNFATFKWRGVDMFKEFGAFIVNESNLKFYNGSSFSNTYASTTFQSRRGELDGISFSGQEISFTVGVYWFSEEDWRRFLNFMNPYEMSDLSFGFDQQYRYFVKLSSNIGDSNRILLGYQQQDTKAARMIAAQGGSSTETENVPMWYTDFTVKFDVLEESVAMAQNTYTFYAYNNNWNDKRNYKGNFQSYGTTTKEGASITNTYYFGTKVNENGTQTTTELDPRFAIYDGIDFDLKDGDIPRYADNFLQGYSDLDMPISTAISFHLNSSTKTFKYLTLTYTAHYMDKNDAIETSQQLFQVTLRNLTITNGVGRPAIPYQSQFNLQYNSEEGMLYWLDGQQLKVLTLLTTNPDGQPVTSQLSVNRFRVPGCLEATNIDYAKMVFALTATPIYDGVTTEDDLTIAIHNTAYARTTII